MALAQLTAMNDLLVHRGPDGEGYFLNAPVPAWLDPPKSVGGTAPEGRPISFLGAPGVRVPLFPDRASKTFHVSDAPSSETAPIAAHVGLGHRRLAIIDLHTGDQPLSNEDGTVWVVFNGEIYNFGELRKELQNRGHRFRTRTDTEVIVHGWEEWGERVVERFCGMFALALWDEKRRALYMARDRLGKKPLYYALSRDLLVFASELKSIVKAFPHLTGEIDLEALDAYLSYGYVPSPRSIFRGVRKLEPAQWALCTEEAFHVQTYWDLRMEDAVQDAPEGQVVEELRELFDDAVRIRLVSDVPLGAFLSGGVDSSAVVASMALQNPESRVRTTSIGFQEKDYDELAYARLVAGRYETDHVEFVVAPDALSVLDRIVWHLDEPFADASAIPTWYVSQMARRAVTVALSGDGGDETFAGYVQRYTMCRLEEGIRRKLPGSLRRDVLGPLGAIYPRLDGLPRPFRLKGFFQNLARPLEEAYCRDMAFYFKPEEKQRLYRFELKKQLKESRPEEVLLRRFRENRSRDPVTRAQYVDLKTYLPEDILVKVDRMSMAHSLEVRAPILDHRVVEWAGALASPYKLNGRVSKYVFKKMNEARLPHDVLHRKKQGFVVPLARWLREDLRPMAEEVLFSPHASLRDYFHMPTIRRLWEAHRSGVQDNGTPLWGLFMFEKWYRTFMEKR